MKRTRSIRARRFQKREPLLQTKISPVYYGVASSALALAGCGGGADEQEVMLYQSVFDCVNEGKYSVEECEAAYQEAEREAQKEGPRFTSLRECEDDFEEYGCEWRSGGHYGPSMRGFIIAEIIDEVGDAARRKRKTYPTYHHRSQAWNEYMFVDGTVIRAGSNGKYRFSPSSVSKKVSNKPSVKTEQKGGFGPSSGSKSSWSSGRSSSGWGG